MSLTQVQNVLIERYLDGRLPLPGPVAQWILNAAIELYYRYAPAWEVLPEGMTGAQRPIAERSDELMRMHYDKPVALFESFLGTSMKYSMGLWERGARNLDEAQEAMLNDLCEKAGIADGQSILDIGCGFGSFATHVRRKFPHSEVAALTLSRVQFDYIAGKQRQPGHPLSGERFRVLHQDFAQCRLDRRFDRIVSIGVFEHVANLKLSLAKIAGLLAPGGAALLHFIVYNRIIEAMANVQKSGFFGRYMFPGSRFWPFNELFRHGDDLRIERAWFLNGVNYRHTVEAWRENFWKNIDIVRALPEVDEKYIRVWDGYLRLCSAMFRGLNGNNLGNGQYLLRHAKAAS